MSLVQSNIDSLVRNPEKARPGGEHATGEIHREYVVSIQVILLITYLLLVSGPKHYEHRKTI